MILIRYLLLCLVGYLIVRAFVNYGHDEQKSAGSNVEKDRFPSKKVSKKIGEYVDYEEVKKKGE
jgi:hypothetical protein